MQDSQCRWRETGFRDLLHQQKGNWNSQPTNKSYRQLRGDLIQAFRTVHNQDCCLASRDFLELATTTHLRGHPLKLRVTGARLDTRKFFFSNRMVAVWNALPEDVVMSGFVNAFKRRLDQHWSAHHNNAGLQPPQ
ncbi:hypothetical protein SprV_0702406900 [Sparganum proliferum]